MLGGFGGSLNCGCLQNFIFSTGARTEDFKSSFHREGMRVWKMSWGGDFSWQLGSSVVRLLLRDKTWRRVRYSRTQICVWHVPPTACQPGTQILSEVSKAEARGGSEVCLPHTPCVMPTRPWASVVHPGPSRPWIALLYLCRHFWVSKTCQALSSLRCGPVNEVIAVDTAGGFSRLVKQGTSSFMAQTF